MARILFYKIEEEDKLVYNLGILLEKIIQQGKRVLVLCGNNDLADQVDKELWTFSPNYFVPHCLYGDKIENDTPIVISVEYSDGFDAVCFIGEQGFIDQSLESIDTYTASDYIFIGSDITLQHKDAIKFCKQNGKWQKA